MKVNPVSIQSYQQLNRRDSAGQAASDAQQKQAVDSSILIEPQKETSGSKLAVKVEAGTYEQYLSSAEKQALDILFARFKDGGKFGSSYQADSQSPEAEQTVGRIIDVKV